MRADDFDLSEPDDAAYLRLIERSLAEEWLDPADEAAFAGL